MVQIQAEEISTRRLALAHPGRYIDQIEGAGLPGSIVRLDPDTYMSDGSLRAAKLAAGAVTEAAIRVIEGKANRAFCAIRPPGHHAEIAEALGFCLFNNIAVAARVALEYPGINKVAVCDFDVHHCNGTVDIFKDDERVLVCSSFQDHFYPYRYLDFTNEHIINTPLEPGTGGADFRHRIESQWLRKIQNHKPDIIFISAGFDAHKDDPLAEINLLEDDYRWITNAIIDLADSLCQGRIVSTLEGGYNLESLASSAQAHVEVLVAE
jgi:acetoin utilization deacetylase AcuC-like enzyme